METRGVLLTVAYDGERFSGWATQPSGDVRTVQDVLGAAIASMDPGASKPRGASRTDAGVHAEHQVAAFDTTRDIESRGWVLGLNAALPDDVAVRAARQVPAGFEPRACARGKRYRYRLLLDPVRNPLWRGRAWRVGHPLDLERMAREASRLEGTHDFRAFRSARDERQNTERTIRRAALEPEGEQVVGIVVEGSAFMHNMVRIIAGTLVDVARGQLEEGAVSRAIASGERDDLGQTAPALGLVLEHVELAGVEGGDPWPR
ncbi:MAG TPA: tRNA pseudouridine(38-40) synthase TruA [Polyangiaceae bacterium]|jgi:tRNA pseudouridine38-40 synthase